MGVWAKSLRLFHGIREHGKLSIRRLADRTGLSKRSVHRHLQALDRRDRYPESGWWETEEGRTWLLRLVVATLCIFGLKRGVGADTISEFFGRLHLEAQVGCSPNALRSLMERLEPTIVATASAWEQEGIDHGEIRPIIGAVDATFLPRMMLVFMDLASGYLLVEASAVDRTYAAWHGLVQARLKTVGVAVSYLVSDRAQALIKLAETGLDCLSIPDVFHLSHDLAQSCSLAIFSRLRHAQQALRHARERLATVHTCPPGSAQRHQAQAVVERHEAEVMRWQGVRSAYRTQLAHRSLTLHPWCLVDLTRQSSQEVEHRLHAVVTALETVLATPGVPTKKTTLAKVRKQLAGVSSLVDLWWQTVGRDVEQLALTPRWQQWVEELMLPLMYWQEHLSRTRCLVSKGPDCPGAQDHSRGL